MEEWYTPKKKTQGLLYLRLKSRGPIETTMCLRQEEETGKLERAIRELDSLRCGFLSEMHDTRSSLAAIEPQQRQLLSGIASAAI